MVDHDHVTAVPIDHHTAPAVNPLADEEQTTRTGRGGEVVDVGHIPGWYALSATKRAVPQRSTQRHVQGRCLFRGKHLKMSPHSSAASRPYCLRARCRCPGFGIAGHQPPMDRLVAWIECQDPPTQQRCRAVVRPLEVEVDQASLDFDGVQPQPFARAAAQSV